MGFRSVIILIAISLSPITAENGGCSVEEEYKKGYSVTPERVAALRDWVFTQPYLPGKYITDMDLVLAVNRSNGCLDDAKQKLDHYFTVKTMFKDLFKDRVMSEWWLNNTLNATPMFDLPTKSKKGYKTLYLTFDKNAEQFDLTDICKYVLMVTDLSQHLECTWSGMILIVDLQNFTECHVDKMQQIDNFQQYFYYLESVWMGYIEGLHYINPSEAACDNQEKLEQSMSKTLLKKEYFHKNRKSLEKYFPIDELPIESGGKSKSIKEFKECGMKKTQSNQAYFVADRKKRPGGPKNMSHIMEIIKESLPEHYRHCEFCH